mgnify:CR=1 FL=1
MYFLGTAGKINENDINTDAIKNQLIMKEKEVAVAEKSQLAQILNGDAAEDYIKSVCGSTYGNLGEKKYLQEKTAFLDVVKNNKELSRCSSESLIHAFVQVIVNGKSLSDGGCYIIPRKGVAHYQDGYLGKLQDIRDAGYIVHDFEVVYEGEECKVRTVGGVCTVDHVISYPRDKSKSILLVYGSVEKNGVVSTYRMDKDKVKIILEKSQPYQSYIKKKNQGQMLYMFQKNKLKS